jgi:hypothetical protein
MAEVDKMQVTQLTCKKQHSYSFYMHEAVPPIGVLKDFVKKGNSHLTQTNLL